MAPLAATKTFVLSTRWSVAATSSGAPIVIATAITARMTLTTLTDRISLTV